MKFKLTTSGHFYKEGTSEIKALRKLGFKFTDDGTANKIFKNKDLHKEYYEPEIEINNLEDLSEFAKGWGEIVFDGERIEIYDDYRE